MPRRTRTVGAVRAGPSLAGAFTAQRDAVALREALESSTVFLVHLAFARGAIGHRLTLVFADDQPERDHLLGSETVVMDHHAAAGRDKAEPTDERSDIARVVGGGKAADAVGGGRVVLEP